MGFNTAVIINNDYLHDIANDPNFGPNLVCAIQQSSVQKPVEIHGARVITSQHADSEVVIVMKWYTGKVLGLYAQDGIRVEQEEGQRILERLADEYGYELVKKGKP